MDNKWFIRITAPQGTKGYLAQIAYWDNELKFTEHLHDVKTFESKDDAWGYYKNYIGRINRSIENAIDIIEMSDDEYAKGLLVG